MAKTTKGKLSASRRFPKKYSANKTQVIPTVAQAPVYPKSVKRNNVKFGMSKSLQGRIVEKPKKNKSKPKKVAVAPPVAVINVPAINFEPILPEESVVKATVGELMLLRKTELQKICDNYGITYTNRDKKAGLCDKLIESGKI